jgi:GWxTD domain-containing protein
MRRFSFLLLLMLTAGPATAGPDPVRSRGSAEALYQRALELLGRNTVDGRRQALRSLEDATLLEPDRAEYQITLARAYYSAGFLRSARQRFEIAARLRPDDAEGQLGLGLVWRRDWLKYLEPRSLDHAAACLASATRLDSMRTDAWLALASLRIEQGDVESAVEAGRGALRSDPDRLEARLAMAQALYHEGRLAAAESLYRATIPLLPRHVRQCFEDIAPVATEQDTTTLNHLSAAKQAEFVERFWSAADPDLTTPENEALLEYWSRVTQAYFLFFNAHRRSWDERGEIYARYGPPVEMRYNPLGAVSGWANVAIWTYPGLGMSVRLVDRLLSEFYMLPVNMYRSNDPMPDPDSLARRAALPTANGRGVFHLVPPGTKPLPVEGAIARFEGAGGPRLLAQLETPGEPSDSAWADWAVLDSARAVRRRAHTALSPSGCDAARRQVADFSAELEPGTYLVAVTVRDAKGRRGVLRTPIRLGRAAAELALSDIVPACGGAEAGSTVRIRPNPTARVPGAGPLTAYFEIYHLQQGADGLARFEYVYQVRTLAQDNRHWITKMFSPSPPPSVSVTRQEQQIGALRRQFITVPVAALSPGPYRLEIVVRDLVAGTESARRLDFEKTD